MLSSKAVFHTLLLAIAVGVWWPQVTGGPTTTTQASTRWEYKVANVEDMGWEVLMDRMGKDGWELVTARRASDSGGTMAYESIFKRPAAPAAAEP